MKNLSHTQVVGRAPTEPILKRIERTIPVLDALNEKYSGHILVINPEAEYTVVSVDEPVVIGRAYQPFLSDPAISRDHCRIGPGWLEDLSSSNGTWRNNERVTKVTLTSGDWIQAGQTSFVYLFFDDLKY